MGSLLESNAAAAVSEPSSQERVERLIAQQPQAVVALLEPGFRAGDDSRELLMLLSRAYAASGSRERCESVTTLAVQKYPDSLAVRVAHAESAMACRDWTAADERWRVIESGWDEFSDFIFLRHARVCVERDDLEQASTLLARFLRYRPGHAGATALQDIVASRRAKKYRVELVKIDEASPLSLELAADQRRIGNRRALSRISVEATMAASAPASLIVRRGEAAEAYPMVPASQGHAEALEGWRFSGQLELTPGAEIGVECSGVEHWSYRLKLEPVMEVLVGQQNWLFLANDVNASIDLFTGQRLLSQEERQRWERFAEGFKALQRERSLLFLIANAKEKVRPERYPYDKADVTVTEQVKAIFEAAALEYLDPLATMQDDAASYYPTDTHWSGRGAYLAFRDCLRRFGYDDDVDSQFRFVAQDVVGDLGSKIDPPATSATTVVSFIGESAVRRAFANDIPGTGNITMFTNELARYRKTLVIFGGSSVGAGGFARLFAYLFQRVVTLNLPGSYVSEVVELERAAHVIVQTNERYLTQAGKLMESLDEANPVAIGGKLAPAAKAELKANLASQPVAEPYFSFSQAILSPPERS
ncbi:alginate O-acetyltransferase AlgX-related protein [Salinicola rhizosphaerae]|uniref:AlgX/AlgJ SGNH hydrolase-like domain-containing protein n=1 Tax=Salinicola rhizosphaerae TaxID=1443141 RepID=A0ABQ3DQP4_9GAMM|nr:hypothetical protein [Salinicola rhizosphaerae]GHB12266.1 hypothetical protein GCM10009038_07510 [Salinicola rhizosphaerae]